MAAQVDILCTQETRGMEELHIAGSAGIAGGIAICIAGSVMEMVLTEREVAIAGRVQRIVMAGSMRGVWIPDNSAMDEVLRRAPRTSPGPDGILHKLWQACALAVAGSLPEALQALAAGARPPRGFSSAWLAVLPKGMEPTDTRQAAPRRAKAPRPLC